jgi:hypothetical protein
MSCLPRPAGYAYDIQTSPLQAVSSLNTQHELKPVETEHFLIDLQSLKH